MSINEIFLTLCSSLKRRRFLIKVLGKLGYRKSTDLKKEMDEVTVCSLLHNLVFDFDKDNYTIRENYLRGIYELAGNAGCRVKASGGGNKIDWNTDPVTGIVIPPLSGDTAILAFTAKHEIDVKALWDMGRMQTLPYFAIYYTIEKDERYRNEFLEQVESFYEQCGDCRGVQWACVMDAAIRAANLLIAYDIFSLSNPQVKADDEFCKIFTRLIYLHGQYIADNLEVDVVNGRNHNHYLADICGLLFISSYLTGAAAKKWYKFSRNELLREAKKQFQSDGTNFEYSTSYHDLSCEFLVYGLALISRKQEIPDDLYMLLLKAGGFSEVVRKRSGERVQIGDNDSGRLFKLSVSLRKCDNEVIPYYEDHLSSDGFLSALSGLVINGAHPEERVIRTPEYQLIQAISGHSPKCMSISYPAALNLVLEQKLPGLAYRRTTEVSFENCGVKQMSGGTWIGYPNFGLFYYHTQDADVYFYSGGDKKWSRSHAHHDMLHFEVSTDEQDYFSDPGTGWYNIHPEWRTYFRSDAVHSAPYVLGQALYRDTTFFAERTYQTKLLFCCKDEICAEIYNDKAKIRRTIKIEETSVLITDESNLPFYSRILEARYCSKGYGMLAENNVGRTPLVRILDDTSGEEVGVKDEKRY